MSTTSLAVDIGAESGRIVAGTLAADKLEICELCRFPNTPLEVDGTLRWNIQQLLSNVEQGIRSYDGEFMSVGVDTWGVDYVLLDNDHRLVEQPFHYRDRRTEGRIAEVCRRISRVEIYEETGIQFLPFNTVYQLASAPKSTFFQAKHFLTIPDYIHHQLSKAKQTVCEYTNATTTQLLNARTGNWSQNILDRLEIPRSMFPEVIQPGTSLGPLAFGHSELIAPACHDTGSAVVAIPSASNDVVWISSGTWSILGIESPTPIINEESYRLDYTNEGGVFGTVRVCKNVMGLWILQECRRTWGDVSYAELMMEAQNAESIGSWIDPDEGRFLPPGDMPCRILDYLKETNQKEPTDRGEMVRIVLESLALKYAILIENLSRLAGRNLETIHIFGGGSQNSLLNQLTANACNRPVVAGPVEATAIGNLLMQMISRGAITSLAEARSLVRNSFECKVYKPENIGDWQDRNARYASLLQRPS